MADRLRTISLRRFREQAAEINEPVDIAVRDRAGNFQIIGYFTPYENRAPGPTPAPLDLPVEDEPEPTPRVIRTPEEAAAAAPAVRPFPKSAQTGRRRTK